MSTYQVTSAAVVVRDHGGAQHMFYEKAVFDDGNFDAEHVAMLLEEGFIESFDGGEEPSEPEGPPAKSASKADWEAYARSQGATDDDLDGVTKDDLVATYGD